MDNLLDVQELSTRLGFHPDTVREYLREGKIKGMKIGKRWRVKEEDLQKFLDEQE